MNKVLLPMVAMVLGITVYAANAGRLYKWVDKQGNVSYHDQAPPADSGYHAEEKRYQDGPPRDLNKLAAEKNPVVLYSIPKCPVCDTARAYLSKNNVPFVEKNVEKDPELQKELKEKSGQLQVPTLLIGKTVFDGYVESILARELATAGYQIADAKKEEEKKAEEEREKKAEETKDVYKPRRTY